MLWVYGHFKYFSLSVRGSTLDDRICVYGRQTLTSKVDPGAERVSFGPTKKAALSQRRVFDEILNLITRIARRDSADTAKCVTRVLFYWEITAL